MKLQRDLKNSGKASIPNGGYYVYGFFLGGKAIMDESKSVFPVKNGCLMQREINSRNI
jgi:hypothetical protein